MGPGGRPNALEVASFSPQDHSSAKRIKLDAVKQPLDYEYLFGHPVGRRAVLVEVFEGCARLSRFAQQAGFVVLPLDGPRNVHKPEAPLHRGCKASWRLCGLDSSFWAYWN